MPKKNQYFNFGKPGTIVYRIIDGVKVAFQVCACGTLFQKTRKDRNSCKNSCAQKNSVAWQERNKGKKQ